MSGEFIDWMRQVLLPQVTNHKLVSQPRLMRLIGHNGGGVCFALQVQASSLKHLQQWNLAEGKRLHKAMTEKFGDKVAGFTTLMEVIEI